MSIADNILRTRVRIARAAARAGRTPDEITLVAVSKTRPLSQVAEAAAAGQVDFGENRIEELSEKSGAAANAGFNNIRWHAIGAIQSRKARLALENTALIHAVDRPKIAQRLSRFAAQSDRTLDVLLEVNVSREVSKFGFSPEGLMAVLPDLLQLPALRYHGLMTMAPLVEDPELARPCFQRLRSLLDDLRQTFPPARHPRADWKQLSMGMTNDFEVAIEEGATIVRIGTAIFGHREFE